MHPYLKRRNKEEDVDYPSEEVKGVLKRTLGVPIFQEQVIQLAGRRPVADQLRRAMAAWKKTGELEKFHGKLVDGMVNRGYTTEYAQRIYQQICGFGEYGFPESHSASFALLAYASAWLKQYYPEAFYTALLNSHPMGFYSPSQLIQDARRHGLEVQPVCVNRSERDHCLEATDQGWAIRLGFRLVKGLSEAGMEQLLRQPRDTEKRRFTRVPQLKEAGLNQRDLEALASANALHALSDNRYQTRWALMDQSHSLPLFAGLDEPNAMVQAAEPEADYLPAPSELDNLVEDYASTGLTLNRHPITLLDEADVMGRFTRAKDLITKEHKSMVVVAGVVTGRQSPGTAAGVTFITLEDDTGNSNVVVWLATARAQKQAYLTARVLKVHGILEREGEVIHIIAGRLEDLSHRLDALSTRSRDFH